MKKRIWLVRLVLTEPKLVLNALRCYYNVLQGSAMARETYIQALEHLGERHLASYAVGNTVTLGEKLG